MVGEDDHVSVLVQMYVIERIEPVVLGLPDGPNWKFVNDHIRVALVGVVIHSSSLLHKSSRSCGPSPDVDL